MGICASGSAVDCYTISGAVLYSSCQCNTFILALCLLDLSQYQICFTKLGRRQVMCYILHLALAFFRYSLLGGSWCLEGVYAHEFSAISRYTYSCVERQGTFFPFLRSE